MNELLACVIALTIAIPACIAADYCSKRCGALDVAAGRRSWGDVAKDYGSDRGFYWPWSPLYLLTMLVAVVPVGFLILMFIAWVMGGGR